MHALAETLDDLTSNAECESYEQHSHDVEIELCFTFELLKEDSYRFLLQDGLRKGFSDGLR